MDELTRLIKQEIKKKYKSVRQFSFAIGVAQTTVVSALKNGVSGTAFSTVMKMCKALDIQVFEYETPLVINDDVSLWFVSTTAWTSWLRILYAPYWTLSISVVKRTINPKNNLKRLSFKLIIAD